MLGRKRNVGLKKEQKIGKRTKGKKKKRRG